MAKDFKDVKKPAANAAQQPANDKKEAPKADKKR